jgi:hypothetical protein
MIQFPNYSYDYQLLIKHILDRPLEWAPEQTIHYRDKVSYTYREFYQRVKKLANLYTAIGVEKGDVVAVMDYDSHRYLENYFTVPMTGAILHTINIRLSPEQMLYTINHAEDKVLVVHKDFEPLIQKLAPGFETVEKVIYISDGDEDYSAPFNNEGEYEKLLAGQSDEFEFPDFDEKTIATLFYTTGTTGNPKGVYFTHRQLVLHTISEIAAFNAFSYPISFNYTNVRDMYCENDTVVLCGEDRVVFVHRDGPLDENSVGAFFASRYARRGSTIVTPINSSGTIVEAASRLGLRIAWCRIGPPEIAHASRVNRADFAYEETGEYMFVRDGFLWGDAVLSTLYMLKVTQGDLTAVHEEFPPRAQVRRAVPCPRWRMPSVMARVGEILRSELGGSQILSVDGYKAIFPDASWLLIRASGTEPVIRVYSEGPDEARARELSELGMKIVERAMNENPL